MTMENLTIPTPTKTGYSEINGVNYYFEIRGEGEPLLLLHGGLGTIEMFGPVLAQFSDVRTVIAVDLHGHGRTGLGERPIDLKNMGDDMAALIGRLGFEMADVLGYSLGGSVGLRMAIQHPETVSRLVIASAVHARDGFYPEIREAQKQLNANAAAFMKETPMYQSYAAVAPKPEDFPKLLDAMGYAIRTDYDWSEEVKTLKMPVMLVYGDADMFQLDYIMRFYQLLGGGRKDAGWMRENLVQNRLAILPDLTHYELFASPQLAKTALPFLNGESNAPLWIGKVHE